MGFRYPHSSGVSILILLDAILEVPAFSGKEKGYNVSILILLDAILEVVQFDIWLYIRIVQVILMYILSIFQYVKER